MANSFEARLQAALDSRRTRSNLRSIGPTPSWAPPEGPQALPKYLTKTFDDDGNHLDDGPEKDEDKLKLIDFSSNDYLSLASSKELQRSFYQKLIHSKESPLGPSSSRLLDGNTTLHRSLEEDLTTFFRGRAGLLFNSGFDANVSIWSTIPGPNDWVIYDHLIHASVHDGLRLSRTKPDHRVSFLHNSIPGLEQCLKTILQKDPQLKSGQTNVFISVESLYSMDGDLCPLKEMVELIHSLFLDHGNAYLVVDEAHSSGLYESSGRGLVCALSVEDRVLIRLHTFGKAMACSGAIALLPPLLREYLINYARPLIFSTVMTRMNVLAISAAIEVFKTERRLIAARQLETLCRRLSNQLAQLLFKYQIDTLPINEPRPSNVILTVPRSTIDLVKNQFFSPIIPILTHQPRELAKFLYRQGLLLRPIGTPTVPPGREQVRVCLHANQTFDQVDYLVQQLDSWISSHLHRYHL